MTPAQYKPVDVLVIGAGNAAANAALSAHEAGASVAMLETAPESARGGNSAFTGGAFRFVYDGIDELLALAPDIAGGLYDHNYGSGTGLVAGVTFGRIAGSGAAAWAQR